jgi:hypothetical protein
MFVMRIYNVHFDRPLLRRNPMQSFIHEMYLCNGNKFTIASLFFLLLLSVNAIAVQPDYASIHSEFDECRWDEIESDAEKAKVFSIVFESSTSNYSKLVTWQASYKLNAFFPDGEISLTKLFADHKNFALGMVDFSVDLKKDMVNWKYECTDRSVPDEQINFDFSVPITTSGHKITREDLTYQHISLANVLYLRRSFTPFSGSIVSIPNYELSDQNIVNVFAKNDIRPSRFSQHSFDPRLFFCSTRGGDEKWYLFCFDFDGMASRLRGLEGEAKQNETSEHHKIFKSNSNNELLYKIVLLDGAKFPFSEKIFSSKAGFNIVQMKQTFGADAPAISLAWRYKNDNDVFVPMVHSIYHAQGKFLIEYQLKNSEINPKLSSDVFSFSALGINENDIIVNYQEKVNYIFRNGKAETLCNFGESPKLELLFPRRDNFWGVRLIFLSIGVLLILIGIWLKILNRKSKQSS